MMTLMDWLNYHHLYYFWVVVQKGSIARACDELCLAQPTISGQIRELERAIGDKLFARAGRNLALTDTGRTVYRFADEIFSIGRELVETLKGQPSRRTVQFRVGVADVLPKLVVFELLKPAMALPESLRLICREGPLESLLVELAMHTLDLVVADRPLEQQVNVRAFNHRLGDCGVSIVGRHPRLRALRKEFPRCLDGVPFLMPGVNTLLRRSLDTWFGSQGIRPLVRAEFDDSALMKTFGQSMIGFFPVPTAIEEQVRRQYGVQILGRVESVRENYYAISVERKVKHPAVVAITDGARQKLFA